MKTIMFWLTVIILIALDLAILEAMYNSQINILDITIFIIINAVGFLLIKRAKEDIIDDKPKV